MCVTEGGLVYMHFVQFLLWEIFWNTLGCLTSLNVFVSAALHSLQPFPKYRGESHTEKEKKKKKRT